MNNEISYLSQVTYPESVVTAIPASQTFPEFLNSRYTRYSVFVDHFSELVMSSQSSGELLGKIREPGAYNAKDRMSFLKLFRRCVSTVIDTEKSKKQSIPTALFIDNYGDTFKHIDVLKSQFINMPDHQKYALTALIGEYDDRGKHGYILTDLFFSWFEESFNEIYKIEGPRGAGRDIQLVDIFPNYIGGSYPCDFVITDMLGMVKCIGFARYDSTRGGSQSDDRTGGNNDKILKAEAYTRAGGSDFKILFLSDGPGLTHRDTWEEACSIDGKLNDRVRVSTLKLAHERITEAWLNSN